jgi:glycosyltransferase involved in cell wall biosynthesis
MNIVIVAYYATWVRSPGSRRVGAIARHLARAGHEVTMIGAQPPDRDGAVAAASGEHDGFRVVELPAADRVERLRRAGRRMRSSIPGRGSGSGGEHDDTGVRARHGSPSRLNRFVLPWISFPDTMWEWHRAATASVVKADHRVDLVIGSSPPMACLRSARDIADRLGCPWIADLRDLWTGDPYRRVPHVLRPIDAHLERTTLRTAAAITTVATPLADELRSIGPPVFTIPNGFADEWLRTDDGSVQPAGGPPSIVYTGTIRTSTHRDLSPVLAVLERSERMVAPPTLEVYGPIDTEVERAVMASDLGDRVVLHGSVDPAVARSAQHRAAVLLSLGWNDPRDRGSTPAKLFEYAAARRPILHIGDPTSEGSRLIEQYRLGRAVSPGDPNAVHHALAELLDPEQPWQAPTPEDLAPLSQRRMAEQFADVVLRVTATSPDTAC